MSGCGEKLLSPSASKREAVFRVLSRPSSRRRCALPDADVASELADAFMDVRLFSYIDMIAMQIRGFVLE